MMALPELSANIYVFVILSDFPKGIESVFSKITSPDELFINLGHRHIKKLHIHIIAIIILHQ